MIDPTRLQPLNWIQDAEGNRHPVTSIYLGSIRYSPLQRAVFHTTLINGKSPQEWYPIPLTLELMKELGFALSEEPGRVKIIMDPKVYDDFDYLYFLLQPDDHGKACSFVIQELSGVYTNQHEYLHELQQVFESITGNPLILNLWSTYTI